MQKYTPRNNITLPANLLSGEETELELPESIMGELTGDAEREVTATATDQRVGLFLP